MAPPPVHPPARKLTSAASMLSWLPKAAVLLLAALASGASGLPVLATPTRYGVEEGMDADISWHLPPAANLASAHVICIMQSEPVKVLYHVDGGREVPAHRHFRGRVWRDEAALARKCLKLRLSAVTPQDAGHWVCQLRAERHPLAGEESGLDLVEYFMLDVRRTKPTPAPGEGAGVATAWTPVWTPGPAPLPHQAANTLTPEMIFFFAIFILVVPGVLAVLERWYFRKRDQKKTVPIPCPLPSGTTCPCRGPHSDRLIAERV